MAGSKYIVSRTLTSKISLRIQPWRGHIRVSSLHVDYGNNEMCAVKHTQKCKWETMRLQINMLKGPVLSHLGGSLCMALRAHAFLRGLLTPREPSVPSTGWRNSMSEVNGQRSGDMDTSSPAHCVHIVVRVWAAPLTPPSVWSSET